MAERLSDRQLDARCAEVAEPDPGPIPDWFDVTHEIVGEHPRSPKRMYVAVCVYDHGDAPEWEPLRFSTDLNAARGLEEEIERRGTIRILLYNTALSEIVNGRDGDSLHPAIALFNQTHATARQRAEAFVRVMERP